MNKRAFYSVLAVALTLSVGLIFTMMPGVALADPLGGAGGLAPQIGAGVAGAAAVGLAALRSRLADLSGKADSKLAQIQDGMPDDQVRAIEQDHEALTREIETVTASIASAEAAERNQPTPPSIPNDGAARGADIHSIGTRAGMPAADIEAAIRNGAVTVEAFRAQAFEHLAAQSAQVRTVPGRVVRDEAQTRRLGMATAMAFRMGGEQPTGDRAEMARGFMDNHDLVDFAAAAVGHRGMIRSPRERIEVLERAFHTTSDFPAIFADSINATLERRYALANPTYREISRRRDFNDFRPHTAIGIGEFPMLEKVAESGEIKFGTFGESKETIALASYGKGLRVSRQMLVNDRLGAIGDLFAGYGRTVSRFEEITFYAMMLSANTKLADGKVVFHADHGNLAAGGGAVISVATIAAGQAAMRKQKNIDDATINVTPSILLVSPDKEVEALQYLAPITVNDAVKVNPFVGALRPIVSSELQGNAWYLFANPEDAPVYQWGYLDGYTAPRIRFDEPFGLQGIAMTVEHDFGVGAVDFRGGYKNNGG